MGMGLNWTGTTGPKQAGAVRNRAGTEAETEAGTEAGTEDGIEDRTEDGTEAEHDQDVPTQLSRHRLLTPADGPTRLLLGTQKNQRGGRPNRASRVSGGCSREIQLYRLSAQLSG